MPEASRVCQRLLKEEKLFDSSNEFKASLTIWCVFPDSLRAEQLFHFQIEPLISL
jgi:hypothetical protein